MQSVRIYEMPACKMVSSGTGMFGEGKFNLFDEWLSSQKKRTVSKRFPVLDRGGLYLAVYV